MRANSAIVAVCVLAFATACCAQDRVRAWRMRLEGDLDSMRMVEDFQEQLREAERARIGAVLLEIEGQRSRADVVWRLGQVMQAAPAPIVAYVGRSSGGSIGAGHWALAMLARSVYVHPEVFVHWTYADDLRRLAPDDTDWALITRRIVDAVGDSLRRRGFDAAPADLLFADMVDAWVTTDEAGAVVVKRSQPLEAGGEHFAEQVIFAGGVDAARFELSPQVLMRIFGAKPASTTAVAMREEHLSVISRQPRVITSGLAEAEREVRFALDMVEPGLKLADEHVKEAKAAASKPGAQARTQQAKAVESALGLVGTVESGIREAEDKVRMYPEILRTVPPGKTSLMDESASKRRAAWEAVFNRAWSRVRSVRAAAEGYAR